MVKAVKKKTTADNPDAWRKFVDSDNDWNFYSQLTNQTTSHLDSDSITDVIESVYGDRCKIVGIPRGNSESICGFFGNGTDIYNFELTPDNLSYELANEKKNSYLHGFYFGDISDVLPLSVQNKMLQEKLHEDAFSSKNKQCLKGIPCGGTCITKGQKCSRVLSQSSKQTVETLKARMLDPSLGHSAALIGSVAAVSALGAAAGTSILFRHEHNQQIRKQNETLEKLTTGINEINTKLKLKEEKEKEEKTNPSWRNIASGAIEGAVPGLISGGPTGAAVGGIIGASAEAASLVAKRIKARKSKSKKSTLEEKARDVAATGVEAGIKHFVSTTTSEISGKEINSKNIKKALGKGLVSGAKKAVEESANKSAKAVASAIRGESL